MSYRVCPTESGVYLQRAARVASQLGLSNDTTLQRLSETEEERGCLMALRATLQMVIAQQATR
jgi:hypothetical protein